MNQSIGPAVRTLPGAGIWWETRASLAFVERNLYLVRRYWHLELAFLIFNVASAMSVLYIGEAQMQASGGGSQEGQLDLVLYLGIGTVVWAYLRAVFANVGEMVAWERWEGTIEYTMMAPITRLAHMLGVSLFSIIYGLARSSFLLLVSGVYYPISVLPDWMEPLATVSPATYVLEGMRAALLEGTPTLALGPSILPILILGALTLPIGIAVFNWGERYAKRTGRLKRSG